MIDSEFSMVSSIIDRENLRWIGVEEGEGEAGMEYEGETVLEDEKKNLDIALLGWRVLLLL